MRFVSEKFFPWLLTLKQKERHLFVASDLLECVGADKNFFKKTVTGGKIWVYGYDPKTKQ
jgi:hypothetical protein